jgi:hypothetical protein
MSQSNDPRWAKWDGLIHNQPFVVQMTKIWSPYPCPTPIPQFCTNHWPSLYDGDDPDDPVLVASGCYSFNCSLFSGCLKFTLLDCSGIARLLLKMMSTHTFRKSHRSQVISKLFPLNIHIYHQHSRGSSHVCRPSSSTSPFGPTPSSGPFREDRPPNTSVPCPTGPGVTPRGS